MIGARVRSRGNFSIISEEDDAADPDMRLIIALKAVTGVPKGSENWRGESGREGERRK